MPVTRESSKSPHPAASLAVRAWNLPGDMVAQLHSGEMESLQTFAQGTRDGSGFGGSISGAVTINVNIIDTQTGAQFLETTHPIIAQTVAGQSRSFNANATGWKSSQIRCGLLRSDMILFSLHGSHLLRVLTTSH